jgi:serine/threonine protein kinase
MAPEQMQGSREVDHRADIYSLGVVFYELLTGELPMGKFAPPSKRVQVDVRLDEIVLRALEQQPEQRYQHASEVKTDVDAVVQSGAASSRSQPVGQTGTVILAARWRPRDGTERLMGWVRTLLPGIILFLVMTALIVLLSWITGLPGPREFQRNPGNIWVILFIPGGLSGVLVTIVLMLHSQSTVVRSVTLTAKGLTMHYGSQPSRSLTWDEIAGVAAFREHWWGLERCSDSASSPDTSPRDHFGIDSNQGRRCYFRPDDHREFVAAIDRFAPPDAAWAEALRAEAEPCLT